MLAERVERWITEEQLLPYHARIAVAVSGGVDSIVLLDILNRCKHKYQWHLCIVSVDHMLRGRDSYEDLKFVERICEQYNLSFFGTRIDISEKMRQGEKSMQEVARFYRYQFFEEVMRKETLTHLVTAHHGDDQMETMLMRLTRGVTVSSSLGIRKKRPLGYGICVRPLLSITKEDILFYANEHNIKYREDASNEKDDYTRNRFRKYVLPFLKNENVRVHEHFQSFCDEVEEIDDLLEELTESAMNKVIRNKQKDKITLHIPSFCQLLKPLQRRVIHLILNYLYSDGCQEITKKHIKHIIELSQHEHPSKKLNLPLGLIVEKQYENILFQFFIREDQFLYTSVLSINEQCELPNEMLLRCEKLSKSQLEQKERGSFTFFSPLHSVCLPLVIRTRQNGDRMSLKGSEGTKKLKAIFIEGKVPQSERNMWPVVTDSEGVILWLPSLKKSSLEKIQAEDGPYIFLEYSKRDTY